MTRMTLSEFKTILADHKAWLEDSPNGKRANLFGVDLHKANLRGADLQGANLRRADLSEAKLSGANLSGANLFEADLHGTDLHRANLSGAELSGANLSGADLHGADLSRASLYEADLFEADLRGTNLSRVDHVIALGRPNGWWAYAYLWKSEIWVRVGRRTLSIAKCREYWANKDDWREVLTALDYAETVAQRRGWKLNA